MFKNYVILILILAFLPMSQMTFAQCAQVELTATVTAVSLTGNDSGGINGGNEISLFVGVDNSAATNAPLPNGTIPNTYNNTYQGDESAFAPLLIDQGVHCVTDPLDGVINFNLAMWENDCGADDTYDCNLFCNNDDDYVEVTAQSITLPTRDAANCFNSPLTVTQTFTYTSGADPTNCGDTGETWSITIEIQIRYQQPAPTGNDISVFQCGNMPTLQVLPAVGVTYQWMGGAGTGVVSGLQDDGYTPGASEVDLATPGSYPITVQGIHPCDGSVISSPTVINVIVLPECPELNTATVSPAGPICEGDAVTLAATILPPACGGVTPVEGTDFYLVWKMDGAIILDGRGPDLRFGTADDITGLDNTSYTVPYTGAACGSQDHVFSVELGCVLLAPTIELGTVDQYCASPLASQYGGYGSSTANGYSNGCAGEMGSEGPLNMADYFDPCTGVFDFTTFGATAPTINLDLSALPACSEVADVSYVLQGNSLNSCNAEYVNSWASEANFVFYPPSADPITGGSGFTWSNAGYTNCAAGAEDCNAAGGQYSFANNISYPAGTSAQGNWQILFWDDYDDGGANEDGEINYVFLEVTYIIPPGCAGVTQLDANAGAPVPTFDLPDIVEQPTGCLDNTISSCGSITYDADGTGGYALTAPATSTPGETVYYQVANAGNTSCVQQGSFVIAENSPTASQDNAVCAGDGSPTTLTAVAPGCGPVPSPDETETETTTAGPVTIGPNAGGGGSQTVTIASAICDEVASISISIDMYHAFMGDVELFLISPSGTSIEIMNDNNGGTDLGGGGGGPAATYVFEDGAVNGTIGTGDGAGTYAPNGTFSSFVGEDPNGTWTLDVNDDGLFDGGSLISFTLTVNTTNCIAPGGAEWFTAETGGAAIATGASMDAVVDGGADASVPGVTTFWVACASNPCRIPVDFIVTNSDCSPLPISLVSFTGRVNGDVNTLDWATETEMNTYKFEVERSPNGLTDFSPIGSLPAAGNSIQITNYTLDDEFPLLEAYYRLKVIDFDGKIEYSQVVYLKREEVNFSLSEVYPNPTKGLFSINLEVEETTTINVQITDMLGRVLQLSSDTYTSGVSRMELDISHFANGTYFVHVDDGKEKIIQKIIKVQ